MTDLPHVNDPNDSVIFNVAHVMMNGDTIPSSDGTCMLAAIVSDSLQALDDDAASIISGSSAIVDVLNNDNLGKSNQSTILVEIAVPPKSGCTATIEPDKTLRYLASPSFSGNDSLVYRITGNGTVSTAKVRIKVTAAGQAINTEHIYVFSCQSKTVNLPGNATGTFAVVKDGSRGTATFSNNVMTYVNNKTATGSCSTHGGKLDTVWYNVCDANNSCEQSNVIVHILRTPRVLIADSCSRRPYLQSDLQYKNATYQWHKSTDSGLTWSPVANAKDKKLYVTEDAIYKIAVTYRGDTIETAPAHFVVRKKTRMSNGIFWYDTMLN
jgi:hypothetical protein